MSDRRSQSGQDDPEGRRNISRHERRSIPVPTTSNIPIAVTSGLVGTSKSRSSSSTSANGKRSVTATGSPFPDYGYFLAPFPPGLKRIDPIFSLKSDEALDEALEAAFEQSLIVSKKLGITAIKGQGQGHGPGQGKEQGYEVNVCSGIPEKWKEFLDNNVLCDVTIQTNDGQIFQAHRCILAANCPYFHEQFIKSNKDKDGEGQSLTIILKTVDSQTLQSIIDFCYTGQFQKTFETVSKLLPIASRFRILPIQQQCLSFLIENMTASNALGIYKLGQSFFCPQLEVQGKTFILQNFRQIITHQDFLDLEAEKVIEMLKDDNLNARNEAIVFEALKLWVEHNVEQRRKNIPQLLSCVRFGLMSYGYFTNAVLQWRFVTEDENVRRVLEAPSVLLTSIDSLNNAEIDLNDPMARPRVPSDVVFAVGGWSAGSPTSFIETYDIRADRWFLLDTSDSTPRAYHGLVPLGHYIYMIGGFDGHEHFSSVKRFDPITQTWEEKACMIFPRCYVSCCKLDEMIYVCGGFNGRTRMNSAEKYSPEQNLWELISPMNRPRSDASSTSYGGKVYIAGGFTGTEVLNSVEKYDPKEDQWTFIQAMSTPRSGVSLVCYRNCLYAIGGFNGFTRLSSAEKYDPENPSEGWTSIPDMSSARSNFAAVCADDLLICIGGFNGATTIPYVECYDSKVNEWFDANHMNLNRSALSACVVENLPNAKEYSYIHRVQELLGT